MSTSVNGQARVRVTCTTCGLEFFAAPRTAREYNSGRREPRCVLHRKRRPMAGHEATERAMMRRFWLDRFTLPEIVEMAVHIFPRGTTRGQALTAALREASRERQ